MTTASDPFSYPDPYILSTWDYPSFWWQKFRRIAFRSDVGRGSKFCWRIQNIDCYTISARRTLTQLFMLVENRAMFMANIDGAALQRSLLRAYVYMEVGLPGYSSSVLCALDNNNNLIFNVDTRRKWLPNLPSQGLMLKRSTITS